MARVESKQTAYKPVVVEANSHLEGLFESFYRVRAAVHDLFSTVGADPNRTRESARLLGLSRQLTWRLSRIVCASEPESVLSDMPGRQGMLKFVDACRARGAAEESVRAATTAAEQFEAAIDALSGSRRSLAALMANRGDRSTQGAQERERRKLFEGGGAVWGVQAQVRFVSVFLFPARDDPSMMDAGHATGYVGFRRLRSIPWPLSYEAVRSRAGEPVRFVKHPLDPDGATEGQAQLIKRFCEPQDPEISVTTLGDLKRFELAPGPVGNAGMATVVFGTFLPHLYPTFRSANHAFASFTVLLETPVERVIFDMFVHRDIRLDAIPTTHLCEKLTHPQPPKDDEVERLALPLVESPVSLGRGATGALTPHIPWYPRLVSFVTERIGHAPEEFVGSRFEMAYPPIPAALIRRFPLMPAEH